MLEDGRIGALLADGDGDDVDAAFAADANARGGAEGQHAARAAATTADQLAVGEPHHLDVGLEAPGERMVLLAVEDRAKRGAFATAVRLGDEGGIVENAERHAAHARADEGL